MDKISLKNLLKETKIIAKSNKKTLIYYFLFHLSVCILINYMGNIYTTASLIIVSTIYVYLFPMILIDFYQNSREISFKKIWLELIKNLFTFLRVYLVQLILFFIMGFLMLLPITNLLSKELGFLGIIAVVGIAIVFFIFIAMIGMAQQISYNLKLGVIDSIKLSFGLSKNNFAIFFNIMIKIGIINSALSYLLNYSIHYLLSGMLIFLITLFFSFCSSLVYYKLKSKENFETIVKNYTLNY